jgi:hypothetical protein
MASNSLDAPAGVTRPVVFFDINTGETPAGRIKIGKSTFTTYHCPTILWVFGRDVGEAEEDVNARGAS